jgi:hypothetical protein
MPQPHPAGSCLHARAATLPPDPRHHAPRTIDAVAPPPNHDPDPYPPPTHTLSPPRCSAHPTAHRVPVSTACSTATGVKRGPDDREDDRLNASSLSYDATAIKSGCRDISPIPFAVLTRLYILCPPLPGVLPFHRVSPLSRPPICVIRLRSVSPCYLGSPFCGCTTTHPDATPDPAAPHTPYPIPHPPSPHPLPSHLSTPRHPCLRTLLQAPTPVSLPCNPHSVPSRSP